MNPYHFLSRLLPARRAPPLSPQRIVFIQPCCIGDVVMATAALKAVRRAYPTAHMSWAVGSWSRPAIEGHDFIDTILDTGNSALPVYSVQDFWRFVRQLRAGNYDLAVSLVRSPLMSLAVLLSGIPTRVGIDSEGRGFGYNRRVPIEPNTPRLEAQIYLDVVAGVGIDTIDCDVNVPVTPVQLAEMRQKLSNSGVSENFIVINPAGGNNPGMVMDVKRWLPENFALLADRLAQTLKADVVIAAGPKDGEIIHQVTGRMKTPATIMIGALTFPEIAALAKLARVYIGNDTGLTHLAAAAGAKTVMILGPSDPARYAPFAPNATALWKPTSLHIGGVASGSPTDWNWSRDGIGVDEVYDRIIEILAQSL